MSGSMVPPGGGLEFRDYPRLVFSAPYFTQNPLGEMFAPAVREAAEIVIPQIIAPYVQTAADNAVQNLAVMKAGDTMLGPLFLIDSIPSQDSQAASKFYVDMMVASGGIPEVPSVPPNKLWVRELGAWVPLPIDPNDYLALSGGTMEGNIDMGGLRVNNLTATPMLPNGAAPAQWVLQQISAQSLYQGTWDASNNVPDLTNASLRNNGWSWIATTADPQIPVTITQAIPGLTNQTVYNGDTIVFSSTVGQFQIIHGGGLTMAEGMATFLPLAGGQLTGPVLLSRSPQAPMEAVNLQYLSDLLGPTGGVPEVNEDGGYYVRTYGQWVDVHALAIWGEYLRLTGGALSGALILSDDATNALGAVTLQQLDQAMTGLPYDGLPTMDGTAASGTLAQFARGDHVHPSDTSKAPQGALNNVGRNLLHNGLFNVRQRGLGPFTSSIGAVTYTADRWFVSVGAAGDSATVQVVAQTDANRAAIGDESAQWLLSISFIGGSGASNLVGLMQRIESVARLAAKTVTLSFWASANATLQCGITFTQVFGGGSADVTVAGQPVTLSQTWARYSLTVAIPSIAGKTMGSTANFTQLRIVLSDGSGSAAPVQSGVVNFWGAQLEIGSVATPLEKLELLTDLMNCQRFFQASYARLAAFSGNATGIVVGNGVSLPVRMRATPTVTPAWGSQINATPNMQALDAGNVYVFATGTVANAQISIDGTFAASADL